jgi:hypothetical protein
VKRVLIISAIVIILVAILLIIFYPKDSSGKKEFLKMYSCKVDSDCIKLENPCCDCSQKGSAGSFNKDFEEEYYELTSTIKCDPNLICPIPNATSCNQDILPKCWDGFCGLTDYRLPEPPSGWPKG